MPVPTIDLHCHLDASMRVDTIAELAASSGLVLDRPVEELATVPTDCTSLVEFLRAIDIQVDVLQTAEALERAAIELVEDFAADGVIHGEIRFAPHLHQRGGASIDEIIDTVHQASAAAAARVGISTSLIVCVLRHLDPGQGPELIAAIDRLPGRVQGVDVAGPEHGFPARPFTGFLTAAAERGLGITMHAGEAAGPESVWEAIELGATRIGHGVRSIGDPTLVVALAERGVTLECCPRCNALTRAVPAIEHHPIDELHRAGVLVTVNTDARTSVPTSMLDEVDTMVRTFGWDADRLVLAQLAAANAAFVTEDRRQQLKAVIQAAAHY